MIQRLLTSFVLGLAVLSGGIAAYAVTTITSSALDHIVVYPNDRPTLVAIDTDMQFIATGYTADNQPVTGITFVWSSSRNIGKINTLGIFTGEHGGIGTVTVTSGSVSASVGIVVKGRASDVKKNAQPTVLGATTSRIVQSRVNTNTDTNAALNANASESARSTEQGQTDTVACSAWPTIAWIGLILIFVVLLILYFLLLGDSTSSLWWAPPAVLMIMLLVLYAGVRCGSGQIWVPIVLLAVGAGISFLYYQLLRPRANTLYVPPPQR